MAALANMKESKLKAIDLFSGCGGLTCGLKAAGFSVVAAVEIEATAQATYALNHAEVRLYANDIRILDPKELMRDLDLKPGELDLLAGCPPCQGFSRLRTKNRRSAVHDKRNDLILEFMRFVRELRPRAVMLENVPALARNKRFLKMQTELKEIGYEVVASILNAADYGVPQRRRRLIMLGAIGGRPILAPELKNRRTVRGALGSLPAPSRSRDRLHSLPEKRSKAIQALIKAIPKDGGSRMDLGGERQLECHKKVDGFRDVYGRMAWDDVSPTITSGCFNPSRGRFLHPRENRAITLREAALLQGFPKSYRFDITHGKTAIALMIGNALPPPFVAAHARSLKRCL